MTQPPVGAMGQDPGRVARRRREHERQVVIFSIISVFLFAALMYAVAVFTGVLDPGWDRDFTGAPQPVEEFPTPCLPDDPGLPYGQTPLAHDTVQIRVLNASGLQGIAGAFQDVLAHRGFIIEDTGTLFDPETDEPMELPHNQIRFGKDGIVAAYTLAGQFENIDLVLDDRPGPIIDLIAGRSYDKPLEPDLITLDPLTPMNSYAGCLNPATIEPAPGPTDLVWPPPPPPEPEPVEGEEGAEAGQGA